MHFEEGYLARYYLHVDVAILTIKRVERQVKLAGEHRAVLPAHRQWVLFARVYVNFWGKDWC